MRSWLRSCCFPKKLRLDAVCGADCGAAAFQKSFICLFTLIFSWHCVMWCWSRLRRSWFSHYFPVVFCSHCEICFRVGVHLSRSFAALIHVFCWIGWCFQWSLQSSSLSPNLSVSPVFWAEVQGSILQLSLTISHSVLLLFSAPVSLSFIVSLVPASNLRISHLFHGFVCASFYVLNPVFFFNLSCVKFFVGIVFKCYVAVLVVVNVWALAILHVRHQCYPNRQCLFLRWSRLFVSRSFCIFFSFVWWVEAFCVASIESFVLFCGCLCSRCVAHRRDYHCVEQPESMFE